MGHGLRALGHPVHPILTAFPIALWTTSLGWDVVALFRAEPLWGQMAFWCLALGLAASVPAAVTGLVDFLALTGDDAAERVATRHMMAAAVAASLFAVSLVVRRTAATPDPAWPLLLSAAGWLTLMAAGWYGGELVFGHAVGVQRPADDGEEPTA